MPSRYGSEGTGAGAGAPVAVAPPRPAYLGLDSLARSLMRRGVTRISNSVSATDVLRLPNA